MTDDRAPAAPVESRPPRLLRCVSCGSSIELCAFCEATGCGHAICYRCLRRELRQSMVQPHAHGG